MVAYGFQKQFRAPIISRVKRHTIRAIRTGRVPHARPGQALQLYTGMRTKYCQKIGDAVCSAVVGISMDFYRCCIRVEERGMITGAERLDEFSRQDGFADWKEMRAFWEKEHGKEAMRTIWRGKMIEWTDFVEAKVNDAADGI